MLTVYYWSPIFKKWRMSHRWAESFRSTTGFYLLWVKIKKQNQNTHPLFTVLIPEVSPGMYLAPVVSKLTEEMGRVIYQKVYRNQKGGDSHCLHENFVREMYSVFSYLKSYWYEKGHYKATGDIIHTRWASSLLYSQPEVIIEILNYWYGNRQC